MPSSCANGISTRTPWNGSATMSSYQSGNPSSVPIQYRDLRADDLHDLPTLSTGHFDNLKVDDGTYRVWLCRCGIDDGMPCDNLVTVERLQGGAWHETYAYEAL